MSISCAIGEAGMDTRSAVQLGFVERTVQPLSPAGFPSKAGGAPSWLQPLAPPSPPAMACSRCTEPVRLLCQVYAPYEEKEECFHRTIFVFICGNGSCCRINCSANLLVFRSQLPRVNEYYSDKPPTDNDLKAFQVDKWTKLCVVCGAKAPSHCAKCKKVNYCSRKHQTLDWHKGHKQICKESEIADVVRNGFQITEAGKSLLFEEFELTMEEEDEEEKIDVHVDDEMDKIKDYLKVKEGSACGTLKDVSEEELDQYVNPVAEDKVFDKFKKRIARAPDQVLRYDRSGQPLWITDMPAERLDIPKCPHCNEERQFEFQIMPQLLNFINVGVEMNSIDFGVLAVYTCKASCTDGPAYKTEYVIKQDLTSEKKDS